jgi:hypothetical protein
LRTLLDEGLYDRVGSERIRNEFEERSMRYSAVLTSMLSDRVEDLEGEADDTGVRVLKLESSFNTFLEHQVQLQSQVGSVTK